MNNKDAIGGFFELELEDGAELHKGALALNSARNCLKYVLNIQKPLKLYLPCYICDCVVDVAKSSGIP
jgi:hypothetical protein